MNNPLSQEEYDKRAALWDSFFSKPDKKEVEKVRQGDFFEWVKQMEKDNK
jgi:hypothetical protein